MLRANPESAFHFAFVVYKLNHRPLGTLIKRLLDRKTSLFLKLHYSYQKLTLAMFGFITVFNNLPTVPFTQAWITVMLFCISDDDRLSYFGCFGSASAW